MIVKSKDSLHDSFMAILDNRDVSTKEDLSFLADNIRSVYDSLSNRIKRLSNSVVDNESTFQTQLNSSNDIFDKKIDSFYVDLNDLDRRLSSRIDSLLQSGG